MSFGHATRGEGFHKGTLAHGVPIVGSRLTFHEPRDGEGTLLF